METPPKKSSAPSRSPLPGTPRASLRTSFRVGLALAAFSTFANQAGADTYSFTNGSGDGLYKNGANWTDLTTNTTGVVPDLTTTNLAQINNNGVTANYVPGGDLIIKNGGELEVTNGGFTQTVGGAYLQLNGTGTILVDGGTFNQGTATSGPFNVSGTGNVFSMTAGMSIFNRGFAVSTGLTSTISGGTLTSTGGNLAINSTGGYTMTGGTASFGPASGSSNVYAIQVGTNSLLSLSGGSSLSANGGFTAATGSTTTISTSGTTLTLGTNGINISSGATYTQNNGMVSATSGDVTYNGSVTVNAGSLSTSSGALSGYGTLKVAGGSVTTSGAFNANVSTSPASSANVTLSSGSIAVGGTGTIATGATVSFTGGTYTSSGGGLQNSGTLTLANTVTLHGNFIGQGTSTTIASGANLTLASGEFQFNNDQNYLTGGTISTPLIVGVNGGGVANSDGTTIHALNISGGQLNLTGTAYNGIYGGGSTQYINFTSNSNGVIDFTNGDSLATVQAFISNNVIEYNGTAYVSSTNYSNFTFGTDANGFVTLTDAFGSAPVPEPATLLAGGLLTLLAAPMARRRFARQNA